VTGQGSAETPQRTMRVALTVVGASVVLGSCLAALYLIGQAKKVGAGGASDAMWLGVAFIIAMPLVASAISLIVYFRSKAWFARNLALAREREGRVCPWCRGEPALTPDASPCCSKAIPHWTLGDYQRYWSLAATDPTAAAAYMNGELEGRRSTGTTGATGPAKQSGRRGFLGALYLLPFALMPIVTGSQQWPWEVAVGAVLLTITGIGGTLVSQGVSRYTSIAPLCGGCRYPRRSETEHCPECGHRWSDPIGGTIPGRREVDRRRVVLGASIAIVAFAIWTSAPFWLPSFLVGFRSTASLIAATSATYSANQATAWAELSKRTLTASEESDLFDHLLDSRRGQYMLDTPTRVFMAAYIAAGKATDEQAARVRRESIVADVLAPSRSRLGAAIEVTVGITASHDFLMPGEGVMVVLTEAWFADEPTRRWRAVDRKPLQAISIDRRFGSAGVPSLSLESNRAGQREIVVRVWLIADSPSGARAITWKRDEGAETESPVPSPTTRWIEELALRHRITID
jgi:hypothetical protein